MSKRHLRNRKCRFYFSTPSTLFPTKPVYHLLTDIFKQHFFIVSIIKHDIFNKLFKYFITLRAVNLYSKHMTHKISKLCFLTCLLLLGMSSPVSAQLSANQEYYILNDYYNKVLGTSEDGTIPRLSSINSNSNADSYIFIAETSDTPGYVKLKHKSSGKYLASSTNNTWSVLFQDQGNDDAYLWALDIQFGGSIINKRSPDRQLGCDWTKDAYVGVYYDKNYNSLTRFSVFPALAEGYDASLRASRTAKFTNSYGNTEQDIFSLTSPISLNEAIDLHLISGNAPIDGGSIDLSHEQAWIIFENVRPSNVLNNYLKYIMVKGQPASDGVNVRVALYLDGTAVIPCQPQNMPFTGYSDESYNGTSMPLGNGNHADLKENNNLMKSFKLQRGYMATVSSGINGTGYSRVYVADHQDILIPSLPEALSQRVSSVHIKNWQYVSKKGWCSTNNNAAIANECNKMETSWFYTWSADRSSTYDTEYIPIRQHLYWPSLSEITGKSNSTAVLGFNEPEHSEQHTSDKCSCGGTISASKACAETPALQQTGMRIGSPAPTDFNWLYDYVNLCNKQEYRCDFVAIHCYWGPNEANGAQAWYNRLKEIYDKTKRPIWITEWGYGASWTTESWPSGYGEKLEKNRQAIFDIVNMLENCPFVERYAFYNWDSYFRACINPDDGWVTPAGEVYRDTKSTFAYNAENQFIPLWKKPEPCTPQLSIELGKENGAASFKITNPNGDLTATITIQIAQNDSWKDLYTITDRSEFDNTELTYDIATKGEDWTGQQFRVIIKTLDGQTVTSETASASYIANPNIITNNKEEVPGWTCRRSAANGYTQGTGNTYFEVWSPDANHMNFDYFQEINGLPNGVYELSAACFNSTNGVSNATVNGHVGLYAIANGLEYFAPVTADHEMDETKRLSIPQIVVRNGKARIGIKNIGTMTARWAGADNFELKYVGSENDILESGYEAFENELIQEIYSRYQSLFVYSDENNADATQLLINPDCLRKDNYGWTANNLRTLTGQAWDGNNENAYWDYYADSNLSSSIEQRLTYVPEGTYSISTLMRGSTNVKLTLTVTVNNKNGTQTYQKELQGQGDQTIGSSAYLRGWQKAEIPYISVKQGDLVVIKAQAQGDDASGWWSIDHFTVNWQSNNMSKQLETCLAQVKALDLTTNVGTQAFQIPASLANELTTLINEAENMLTGPISDEKAKDMISRLNLAFENFKNAELNEPKGSEVFNLIMSEIDYIHSGKAVTFIANDRTDQGLYNVQYKAEPNINYAQNLIFTKANEGNLYIISTFDLDGAQRYLCTGSIYGGNEFQIRTTLKADDALIFKIIPTRTEGTYNILNTMANQFIGCQDYNINQPAGVFTTSDNHNLKLVKSENPQITLQMNELRWATLMLPFNANIPEKLKVYDCHSMADNQTLDLIEVNEIKANRPYIVSAPTNFCHTFTGFGTALQDTYVNGWLTGTFRPVIAMPGSYILNQTATDEATFCLVTKEDQQQTIAPYHAYINLPADETDFQVLFLPGHNTTNLSNTITDTPKVDVYNISGIKIRHQVEKAHALKGLPKGIYMISGQKYIIK